METNEYAQRLKSMLALNRNRHINPLVSQIPVQALIDMEYCDKVSTLLNGGPNKWQMLQVSPNVGQMLPARSGLYMFCWRPLLKFEMETGSKQFEWCLYVGKAQDTTLRKRFESEYKSYVTGDPKLLYQTADKTSRKDLLAKYLCIQPLNIYFLTIDDKDQIPDLEDKLIDLLNPPLNKQKSIRARALETVPAF